MSVDPGWIAVSSGKGGMSVDTVEWVLAAFAGAKRTYLP